MYSNKFNFKIEIDVLKQGNKIWAISESQPPDNTPVGAYLHTELIFVSTYLMEVFGLNIYYDLINVISYIIYILYIV